MIGAFATIAIVIAAGWPLAIAFQRRDSWSNRLGLAFLLGCGAATFVLFFESLAGISWSCISVIVPLVAIAAIGLVVMRRDLRVDGVALSPIDAITLIFLAGYARYATIAQSPENDFLGIWGVKARVFAAAGGIDWSFLANPFHAYTHVDYPLLVPLGFDLQTVISGGWPERWLGIFNVAFGVAALLLVSGFLAVELPNRHLAALATFALFPLLVSPWLGLAEGPLIAYATPALLYLRRGARGANADLARGAVLLGLAASCKNEGLALIAAAAIALVAAGAWRAVVRLWPAVAIALPWLIVRSAHHLTTDLAARGAGGRVVQHLSSVTTMLLALIHTPIGKPLFWLGVALALIAGAAELVKRERFLAVAVIVQFAFFIGAYLLTPHDVSWHVRWSWERLVNQLTSVIAFIAIAVIAPLLSRERRS